MVHFTVYKLRGLVNSFSRKCTISIIIIIVFCMASILASILQKTDDYFNISWIYQNYDHSIFAQTVISTGSFVYYNNTVLGIEILIPQQWIGNHKDDNIVPSGDPNLVQFFSPQKDAQLFVTVYPLPSSNMSINAYDKQYNMYSNDPTIHNLIFANTTLSGMPAHQATFMLSYSGKSYHVIHVWTIKNDHVYKLSFSTYDEAFKKYLSQMEIMLSSFNVTRNRIS